MFFEQLTKLCIEKNTTPTKFVTDVLHLSSSKVTAWKNGSIPKYEILIQIANYFDVTVGTLFDGKEKLSTPNISNSIVDHSSGTITIHNNSKESDSEGEVKDNSIHDQESNNKVSKEMNETSKELLEVFESLPMRERVKLLSMVYEYEENYRKSKK